LTIKVNILENGKGIEILASDVVYGYEIIQAHEKIYDEKYLTNQKYHIIDKSKCTEYDVTAEDIETIAELDKKASRVNPNIVMAVIEPERLLYSLTNLWQAHVEKHIFKTRSFANREQALEWIAKNAQ